MAYLGSLGRLFSAKGSQGGFGEGRRADLGRRWGSLWAVGGTFGIAWGVPRTLVRDICLFC